jgi:hypothetical protein
VYTNEKLEEVILIRYIQSGNLDGIGCKFILFEMFHFSVKLLEFILSYMRKLFLTHDFSLNFLLLEQTVSTQFVIFQVNISVLNWVGSRDLIKSCL